MNPKRLLLAMGLVTATMNANSLPETTCTETDVSELITGCTVYGDEPYTSVGDNGVKLHLAQGLESSNEADILKGLNKLFIYVRGIGSHSLEAPYILDESLSPSVIKRLKVEGISTLVVAPGDASAEDSIQAGASALKNTLAMVKNYRTSTADMVIVGHSQGGVVSRYALADLEANGSDHETGLYVSYDAPHSGANIPQGIQNLIPVLMEYISDLANMASGASSAMKSLGLDGSITNISDMIAAETNSVLQQVENFTSTGLSPGSGVIRQLLVNNVDPTGVAARESYLLDPFANSFPSQPTTITVTNGNTQAQSQFTYQDPDTNAYLSVNARKGGAHTYAFMDFQIFPTQQGVNNIEANIGAKGTFSYSAPCFVVFTCNYNQSVAVNVAKNRVTPEVYELDVVPGGSFNMGHWFSQSVLNYAASHTNANGVPTFDQVTPESIPDSFFSYIPTASALGLAIDTEDIQNAIDIDTVPFDQVIAIGNDAAYGTSNIPHGIVIFNTELVDQIMDVYGPIPSPVVVALLQSSDLRHVDNINKSLCKSIEIIEDARNNADRRALRKLEKVLRKLDVMLRQEGITPEQYAEATLWVEELIQFLADDAEGYPELLALLPVSC